MEAAGDERSHALGLRLHSAVPRHAAQAMPSPFVLPTIVPGIAPPALEAALTSLEARG